MNLPQPRVSATLTSCSGFTTHCRPHGTLPARSPREDRNRDRGLDWRPRTSSTRSKVTLRLLLGEQDTKFLYYEYDFGDGWIHEVCNEKAMPPEPGKLYPFCIGGERNCPPEDCGGSHGYQEMLKALRDERDPDHASTVEWIGQDFDPEAFDADAVNRRLRRVKIRS